MIGAPFGPNALRWIDDPRAYGLRFVGFADVIVSGRTIKHQGWFTRDEDLDDDVLRGAVWQLPARSGRAVYVAGYREGSIGRDGLWGDTATGYDSGAGAIGLRERSTGDRGGTIEYDRHESAMRDAALRADRIAERKAEESREYDAAWQAGSHWAGLAHDIAAERKTALALLVEMRPLRRAGAECTTICATLRAAVRSHVASIAEMRAKRTELADVNRWRDVDAWYEGAALAESMS